MTTPVPPLLMLAEMPIDPYDPCAREILLRQAVTPWAEFYPPPDDRWTRSLAGEDPVQIELMPLCVVEAIKAAYPLPTTLREALDEHDYWQRRDCEIAECIEPDALDGETALDALPDYRRTLIWDLVRDGLMLTSLADVVHRLQIFHDGGAQDERISAAVLRDLGVLASAGSLTDEHQQGIGAALTPAQIDDIAARLRANPVATDRSIARALKRSPTTISKVRRTLGLESSVRSVQRRGQTYSFRVREG